MVKQKLVKIIQAKVQTIQKGKKWYISQAKFLEKGTTKLTQEMSTDVNLQPNTLDQTKYGFPLYPHNKIWFLHLPTKTNVSM